MNNRSTNNFINKLIWSLLIGFLLINQGQAQVVAKFTSDTTKGCAPVTINFISQSTGTNLRYLWNFNNGNVSTLANPKAIYYQPGKYDVSLTVTDPSGKQSSTTVTTYIQVFKNPVANFSGGPLSGCLPLSSSFLNQTAPGDGKINSFIWDFGDGNTSLDSIGKHIYKAQGIFGVSLVVKDVNQCEDKKFIPQYVEVLPSPVPQISADKQYYCSAPFTVNFTNATLGHQSSDTYLWDFGDGNTSSSLNPSHTYTKLGSYDVSLTVTKANGCSATRTFKSYIVLGTFTPDFVADKTSGCTPTLVKFTNLSKPTTTGVSFQWEFGDGDKGFSPNNLSHKYTKSGYYDVTLTAEIDGKCKSTITKSSYIHIEESPEAIFTMSDSLACKTPATVYLYNSSKNSTAFKWFIDKASFGTQASTAYTFTTYGDHEVMLIAENFVGCLDTAIAIFKIEKPTVEIEPSVLQGCVPQTITFTRTVESIDKVTDYHWTFEKGKREKINDISTSYTFSKEGTYPVILEITTKSGCKASDTVNIRIGLKTNPSFKEGKDTLCNNETKIFENTTDSKGVKVDSWSWELIPSGSSGSFSTEENGKLETKHPPATYGVMLVSENNGCFDTFIENDKVTILAPLAKFLSEEDQVCNADTLTRKNSSIGEDSIVWHVLYPNGQWKESFWDDSLAFSKPYNNHTLILMAFNKTTGCMDSTSEMLEFPEVTTRASFSYNGSLCAPSTLNFSTESDGIHSLKWYTENDSLDGDKAIWYYTKPGKYSMKLVVQNPTNGCIDSTIQKFTVTGPEVSGELLGKEGCSPVSIKLKCNSDPKDFKELYWLIDTLKIPITSIGTIDHKLVKPGPEADGTYKIKLIGKDSNNCTGYQVFPIKVYGVVDADIKVRRIAHCSGRHFIFQIIAPGTDISKLGIKWDFGDGTTSKEDINDKFFDKEGTYNVVLQLTDANGCITQVTRVIDIIKERLVPNLKADNLQDNCPPLFVKFTDLSTTGPGKYVKSWLWEFGDGSTSIESNPSKLYLFPGKFTVKLTVIDENNCKDSVVFDDFILVSGPQGTYNFDKKTGCAPLDVKFTATQKGAVKYEFDMGDGTVYRDKLNFTHTYRLPGRYIPVLVLTDTFGCTFTRAPIDTIYVYDYPKPNFSSKGVCFGQPVNFEAINAPEDGEITKYQWEFINNGKSEFSDMPDPVITFAGQDDPLIKLTTTNSAGCAGSVEGRTNLSNLHADVEPISKFNCIGNIIKVKSVVSSDTTITKYEWFFDNQQDSVSEITFFADSTGPKQIKLIVTNAAGCSDTLETQKIVVGDTIPPLSAEILRVTVNDDFTVQLDLKKNTSNDFNSYEIFKEGIGGFQHMHSEQDRTKTTYINRGNNTLKNVYCFRAELTNSCGLMSDALKSLKHCTVESKAVGEVNRAVVSWNKYAGWNEISGYEVLREDMSDPGVFVKLGNTSRDETTYIDSNIVCRVEHTYKIKAIEANGNAQISFSDTCKARPIWNHKPKPNELVRATVEIDKFIRIEWDSVYTPQIPIEKYVLQRSDDGERYPLTWSFNANEFDYEDKKVLVDDQSYYYRTYAIDRCNDTSDFLNFGKTILLKADTSGEQRPLLSWSTYQGWDAGVDYYHVEIKNPDGSFSFIGRTSSTDTSLVDEVTNLNQRPDYCYRIIGFRNVVDGKPQVVSVSNEDCSPIYSRLYYPNAFSPNVDGLNEQFGTPGIYIRDYHMSIYSRWGEKIFETRNMDEKWDGTYAGKPAQQDVYAVIVESIGVDRIKRVHYGTITVLR